ncbi:glycosyl transferase family 1 [Flavobacterium fryxellicola]|uniref:Glycosyl transferase family 1 n=2 Tax=Flavobacterium fryxellicola TaxID=249352 RepID=A0A167V243_9FLAO|nr:glycosyl transferase family 1 [Flavobacterium fryxellicola]
MSLDYLLKGQLSFLNDHYEVVAVSGKDKHLDTVALREAVRTEAVAMQRSISPWKDVVSLWKLYLLFRKEKPQIVHSITPKAGLLSMTAAYFARVPIRIHTFTGLIFPSKKGVLQQILIVMDRLLCRFATHIYPEGEGVKEDLKRYGITTKPLKVIANGNVNGIDISFFDPELYGAAEKVKLKSQLNIKEHDFVFIFVGRLVGDKGINELVTAFQKLHLVVNDIKLLLVGPFEQELDPLNGQTLEIINQSDHIQCVGFQTDVRSYFAIADALVFPSYREGFPNVVLQAGAMGLPSIVTNISGCNEIIIEGKNGTIIPVKEVNALYESMLKMSTDVVFRNQLQVNARPLIASRYQQQLVWEAILAEYKRVEKYV